MIFINRFCCFSITRGGGGINKFFDIILNVNDDIEFNPTINNFIDVIKNHKHKDLSFFGPVSDGFVGQPIQLQKGPIDSLIELPGVDWNSVIGGFFVGFTNKSL